MVKDANKQSPCERVFECVLWNSRFCVLLAVVFGLISAIALFILGSWEVFNAVKEILPSATHSGDHNVLVSGVISAIDLYLIGIVLLIFSFGVYELFISKIDVARSNQEIKILEITSLDQLKNRILKVIIMVLVVSFFQRVLAMQYNTPLHMLYFALSILALALGIFLINKKQD